MIEQSLNKHNQKARNLVINNLKTKRLWKDMKKGGEIIADGQTVYKNGKWLI